MLETPDLLVILLCLLVQHMAFRFKRRGQLPLPPGPPRYPLIGSAISFPMKYSARVFARMSKESGSKIMYHEPFGRPIVVLNDLQMAKDLLDKRSIIYSSRPQLEMLSNIMKTDFFLGIIPYGEKFRHHRRLFQQYFSPHDMEGPEAVELNFIRKALLPKFYKDPRHFRETISSCLGAIATSMTYGVPLRRDHDPLVKLAEDSFSNVALSIVPGAFLVEVLPWLRYVPKWFPGASFKRNGLKWAEVVKRSLEEPFIEAQRALNNGEARPSFISANLERLSNLSDGENELQDVKEAAASVYAAASETTTAALLTFILAMLKYPDVQKKAQQEIDAVIGSDRLPEFSDKSSLPYLSAVLKEVLRWNPITPMGLPHFTHEEDIYNGYYIPANSTVIANAYAILHDDEVFVNPEMFNPERYLQDGRLSFQIPDPDVVATFGFGRRICPGAHIALSVMYLAGASILTLFDISYDVDENGQVIDVPEEPFASTGATSEPFPFKCKITPRTGKNVEDMLKEYKDVEMII